MSYQTPDALESRWQIPFRTLTRQANPLLESIPTTLDLKETWLVEYWAKRLGISVSGLLQAIAVVGPQVSKLKRHLKDGHRIAIRDSSGSMRNVVRISNERGGFAVSIPYHPSKEGWVFESPMDYNFTERIQPIDECKNYTVNDTVKLSMHMDGFVQFSRGGKQPIISGYNRELNLIKGAGVKAPDPVNVTTGPLFGVVLQGLQSFDLNHSDSPAEVFEENDLWHHPSFSTPEDTAYNLEVFMFPNSLIGASTFVEGKRVLYRELPFKSKVRFPFQLRVIELPHLPFFLGAILSYIRPDETIDSGYKISGPGCGKPGEQKTCIGAWYPRPDFITHINSISLDYKGEIGCP